MSIAVSSASPTLPTYIPRITQVVDKPGGLYEANLPDASDEDLSVGLVYSARGLNENSAVPTAGIYLKDTNGDYFSVDAQNISLVASGKDLNLFVFQDDGTADKYTFNRSDGQLQSESPEVISALAFSAIEVSAKRDLDSNGGIGAALNKDLGSKDNGVLDSVGGLFRVSSMGEDLFVVSKGLERAKSIDASTSALMDGDGNAWRPDGDYLTFAAVASTSKVDGKSVTTWAVYATDADGEVSRFDFDAGRKLVNTEPEVLTLQELAAAEKQTLRDLNKDNVFGVDIDKGAIDATTGLFKGSVLGQDFLLVGNALKSGTAKAPTDLSGALMNSEGEAWGPPAGFEISAMVKNGASGYTVYAFSKVGDAEDRNTLLQFDFEFNETHKSFTITSESDDGLEVDATQLAEAEKTAKRDLNGDSVFGVKINGALDAVGGLFKASALGHDFLLVGRALTSSASRPTDLSTALLSVDGEGWRPEDLMDLTNNVRIARLADDAGYEVFVKEDSGDFAKYSFGSNFRQIGDREELSIEDLATAERIHQRDLNGDAAFGVKVTALVDAKSNVYKASFESQENIFLVSSDQKLTVGSKVARNGVDLSLALKVDDDYWKEDDGYSVTAGFKKDDNFVLIATANGNANDVRMYTFDSNNQLIDEEGKTGDLTLAELTAQEKLQGRDLNGDKITGVKATTTLDKIGGLHVVTLGAGDNAETFLTVSSKSRDVKDLSSALLAADGSAWKLSQGESVAALVVSKTGTDVTGYALYTSKTLPTGEKQITQINFDAQFTFDESVDDNIKILTQAEISDVEATTLRDINGDKSVGAKVTAVLDKVGGLYQATMNDGINEHLITFVNASSPGRATALSEKMLIGADEVSPWQVDAGFSIKGVVEKDGGGYSVFASKSGTPDEMRRYTFDANRLFTESEVLTAEQLIEAEKTAGRDINGDKGVGLNIAAAVDRKGALYNANVLGQNFLVVGTAGAALRTGKTAENAIDLSRALLAPDGTAWSADAGWSIGGVVANDAGGHDVYTFLKDNDGTVSNVKVNTWDSNFDYVDSHEADLVALVEVERIARRDFSGDGVVGFRTLPTVDSGFAGVTQATVAGGITFLLAGANQKNGTPSNPLSIKNALLNDDGSGPWVVDAGFKVKAVDENDATLTEGKRYVYAVNDVSNEVRRYEFDKVSGKVSGAGDTISAVDLAAKEVARRRDFNGDGATGVATVSSRLDGTRQTGLLNATISGQDFLVINKLPAAGRNINLAAALLTQLGAAWKNPDDFDIKGVYETQDDEGKDIAEVYGTNGSTIERYIFTKQADSTYQLNSDEPELVTGVALAAREAVAGKDLNGDASIGFKVAPGTLAMQSNGWSIGTASVDTAEDTSDDVIDSPTIFIVGKNLGKMGAVASNLANNAALFDSTGYWKPAEGENIISLVQKTDLNGDIEVNIYTALVDEGVTSYVKHAFALAEDKWSLSASTAMTSTQLIAEEAANKRDINGDSAVGLKVDAQFAVTGMTKAVIDDQAYFFAGNVFSGTGTRPLDLTNTRLLTDSDGNAWLPDGELTVSNWEVLGSTLPAGAPTGAQYLATLSDDSIQYFGSDMKTLAVEAAE